MLETKMIRLKVKEFRKLRGLTQEQLARNIDMSLGHIQTLESQRTKSIPYDTLEKICLALDCQHGELLTLEKP
jgi:putative transcriptional regulator